MRERPILFSAPMVLAILAGKKTQTRRLVKDAEAIRRAIAGTPLGEIAGLCPHGQRGDRLWVKETWGLHRYHDETDWSRAPIRGLSADAVREEWDLAFRAEWGTNQEACFWRPSIFMPRWASRLTLEITEVRVERLQDISEEDAKAEGVNWPDRDLSARDLFQRLWDSINGDRASWAVNPWVWVVSFKRVHP